MPPARHLARLSRPFEDLRIIKRHFDVAMRERKRGGEPEGADMLFSAMTYAPRTLRRVMSKALASRKLSNLTISNIPGPNVPLYHGGFRRRTPSRCT